MESRIILLTPLALSYTQTDESSELTRSMNRTEFVQPTSIKRTEIGHQLKESQFYWNKGICASDENIDNRKSACSSLMRKIGGKEKVEWNQRRVFIWWDWENFFKTKYPCQSFSTLSKFAWEYLEGLNSHSRMASILFKYLSFPKYLRNLKENIKNQWNKSW